MLLNSRQVKIEIKIWIEMNENENTTTQNLWDTVEAVLKGRFIAIQAYLKKQEKSQINNLNLQLKQLEKEEMKNPRVSRRKEILKIRAEINPKETVTKINKAKSWFFEKINKIDKPLAKLINKQREISCLSVASFAIIFSHSEGCVFTLLIVSFVVQKLLSLMRSHLFIFALISNISGRWVIEDPAVM